MFCVLVEIGDVSDPWTKPSPVNLTQSGNRKQRTSKQNREDWEGSDGPLFGSLSRTNNSFEASKCRSREGERERERGVEAK